MKKLEIVQFNKTKESKKNQILEFMKRKQSPLLVEDGDRDIYVVLEPVYAFEAGYVGDIILAVGLINNDTVKVVSVDSKDGDEASSMVNKAINIRKCGNI